jgi:hypothetical protein
LPVPHLRPQPPQLLLSLPVVMTQAPPHETEPGGQLSAQTFPLHAAVPPPLVGAGQLVPQRVPQFLGSALDTHAPVQTCVLAVH